MNINLNVYNIYIYILFVICPFFSHDFPHIFLVGSYIATSVIVRTSLMTHKPEYSPMNHRRFMVEYPVPSGKQTVCY